LTDQKKITEKDLKIAKKDSSGLFSGKYKAQTFAGKKEKIEKEQKKEQQKGFEI